MYVDKTADILNKNNNTYHADIKPKLIEIKSSTCIDFDEKSNKKDRKFEVSDHARIHL